MKTIAIIEDDQTIGDLLEEVLQKEGYAVRRAYSGTEAVYLLSQQRPDLALLDLMLPGLSGEEVLPHLEGIPVIVVSAKVGVDDKVKLLLGGAADYLTKPFEIPELLARIRTAIRHTRTSLSNPEIAQSGRFTTGDLVIDYDKHQVLIHGENARLTANEYRIVSLLGKYAGKVLTYDFIIKELWGPKAKNDNQILRVNMANIRRKIEENPGQPKYIFTEVGVGYRMREGD